MSILNNISQKHKEYTNNIDDWKMWRNAAQTSADFLSRDYVPQHAFETRSAYDRRLKLLFTFNLFEAVLAKVSGIVFGDEISRFGDNIVRLQPFFSDATGEGVSFTDYMKRVMAASMTLGKAYSAVLMSGADKDSLTQADIDAGIAVPYVKLFTRDQLVNWVFTPRVGFTECLFSDEIAVEGELKKVYVYMDTQSVQIMDTTGQKLKSSMNCTHEMGYCPVFVTEYTGVGNPLGKILGPSQMGITNLLSIFMEISEKQAFSQLIIPDDGTIQEMHHRYTDYLNGQVASGEVSPEQAATMQGVDTILQILSESSALTWPAGTGHPPSFISPNGSQLETIFSSVLGVKKESIAQTGLADSTGDITKDSAAHLLKPYVSSLATHERRIMNAVSHLLFSAPGDYYSCYEVFSKEDDVEEVLSVCDRIEASTSLDDTQKKALIDSYILKHISKRPDSIFLEVAARIGRNL